MILTRDSRKRPKLGLSLSASTDFFQASAELFEKNEVQVLEWSFDSIWNGVVVEPWCQFLINKFTESGALIGHGVTLSPLSARFSDRQRSWLSGAHEEFSRRKYLHASEHFGFSEAGPVEFGAPLAVPMNSESLYAGKETMKRYAEATQCMVGLENLAFAFSQEDAKRQGDFVDKLIASVDGFLLLDLHNIYCQLENFRLTEKVLLDTYPLSKVREIHISGGSWSPSVSGKRPAVRRDTHDDSVPQEVFNLAALALKLCPNVEFVILERLGNTMLDSKSQQEFRDDFRTMKEILALSYT